MTADRNLVAADDMAALIDRDRQFRLPRCPRFAREFMVVAIDGGLLVEGAAERVVFRGPGAVTVLPALLPLLDGRRTVEEIAARLVDVPIRAIRNAIALLYTRGLLDDGDGAAAPAWTSGYPDVAAFFRRHVDVTRVHRNAEEALIALRALRIVLVGDRTSGAMLAAELANCGMAPPFVCESLTALDSRPDLVVALVRQPEDRAQLRALDGICAAAAIPWLRTSLAGDRVEIGPRFERGETACYQCFENTQGAAAHDAKSDHARERAWLSLVATEIVYLASRIGELATGHAMLVLDLGDWSQVRARIPRLAGCPRCGPVANHRSPDLDLVWAFEQSVTTPSKKFLDPKSHQLHYRIALRELQQPAPRYSQYSVMPLPSDDERTETTASSPCSPPDGGLKSPAVDVNLVATLLRRSVGIRADQGGRMTRWAPTVGNLGSVEIYLMPRGIAGLEERPYYYDPHRDVLVCVRPDHVAREMSAVIEEICAGRYAPSPHPLPAAILVLTAALGRVMTKYGPLGYRLAHLDAGVALAQLDTIAAGKRVAMDVRADVNGEAISRLLQLDDETEAVTAVAVVRNADHRELSDADR